MNEQITAIAALLLEINGKEKYTAFFDFSGHVRTFSIRIYSGKWSQGKDPLFNLATKQGRTAMAELGQRACHVRRFDPLILNDFIMKSYEEIIQRTADFDYMMRTQLPEKYMSEVFGVTAEEDPDLRQLLHNASRNGIGITYLLFKIPYDRHKQLIKYLSK